MLSRPDNSSSYFSKSLILKLILPTNTEAEHKAEANDYLTERENCNLTANVLRRHSALLNRTTQTLLTMQLLISRRTVIQGVAIVIWVGDG